MKNFFKKLMSSKSQSKYFSETVQRVGKNNAGFSLVELIVVIAIMAILAAVAVIGVSVYIPKAQKAADEQLVSDIEDALMYAYYADPDKFQSGSIVISVDENATASNDFLAATLAASFGDNWQNSLRLQYDGWTNSAGNTFQNYNNSTYIDNQQKLLSDVQQLTNALQTFVETSGSDFIGTNYNDFATKYGIDVSDSTQVSNAASLYVAEQTVKVNEENFVKAWTRNNGASADVNSNNFTNSDVGSLGLMGALAAHYARAESLAAFIDGNPTYSGSANFTDENGQKITASQWLSQQPVKGNSSQEVSECMAQITNGFASCLGTEAANIIKAYGQSSQSANDAKAYISMMGAIVENSDTLLENIDKEDTMYTDGVVDQMINNYMSAGEALSTRPAGSIAIAISTNDNGYSIMVVGMNENE